MKHVATCKDSLWSEACVKNEENATLHTLSRGNFSVKSEMKKFQ